MNRKDMEALVDPASTELCDEELEEWAMNAWEALKELLSATRWRKTEEELPKKRGNYLVHLSGYIHRTAWWTGRFEIDGREVKPVRWLPIPEVSDEGDM